MSVIKGLKTTKKYAFKIAIKLSDYSSENHSDINDILSVEEQEKINIIATEMGYEGFKLRFDQVIHMILNYKHEYIIPCERRIGGNRVALFENKVREIGNRRLDFKEMGFVWVYEEYSYDTEDPRLLINQDPNDEF